MPLMSSSRSWFGADVLNGLIYAAGGLSDCFDLIFDAPERFDPIIRKWAKLSRMHEKHWMFDLVSSGGFLYAMGGSVSTTVEKYDPVTDAWIMAKPMIHCYDGVGAAVLDCPDPQSVISPS